MADMAKRLLTNLRIATMMPGAGVLDGHAIGIESGNIALVAKVDELPNEWRGVEAEDQTVEKAPPFGGW